MGCTDTTEHVIEVTNSEPFQERFRQIASPMVEEVQQHIQEMLDGGAIRPSQSPWFNTVVYHSLIYNQNLSKLKLSKKINTAASNYLKFFFNRSKYR